MRTRITNVFAVVLLLLLSRAAWAEGLTITIVEGDEAILNVRQRVNREAIVQVEDDNHRPVAGAIVVFTAPENGPSATFLNGAKTASLTTNAQGRATLSGIQPNQTSGKFRIRVNASKDGQTGSTTMGMSVVAGATGAAAAGGLSTKLIIGIIAAAAATAVGVAVAVNNGGGHTTTTTPPVTSIILTPGNPTAGAPPH